MGYRLFKASSVPWICFFLILTIFIAIPPTSAIEPAQGSRASGTNDRIVFVSDRNGSNDLYTMNLDGSHLVQLTDDFDVEIRPQWSPDGRQIAYFILTKEDADLYVMDADGTNVRRLTSSAARDVGPSWSPDGTKLIFDSDRSDAGDIYTITVATGVIHPLIAEWGTQEQAVWSPDGTQIAYISHDLFQSDIYIANADGTNIHRLTNNANSEFFPVWSPDSMQIAFQAGASDTDEVYVIDADGKNQRQLTDNTYYDGLPDWSPDGTQILFTSGRDGRNIYLMNADGSNVQPVTTGDSYSGQADWQHLPQTTNPPTSETSRGMILFTGYVDVEGTYELYTLAPDGHVGHRLTHNDILETGAMGSLDGTRIVFEGRTSFDDKHDIYTMDADGTNVRQLTNTADKDEWYPSWSPDGSQILFRLDDQIYTMHADGSHVRKLTHGSSYNETPSWSPDGKHILFSSDRQKNKFALYMMDVDGTNVVRVSNDSQSLFYGEFSPDGTHIVFSRRVTDDNYDLYIIDADGTHSRLLYGDDEDQALPIWSPDGTQIVFTSTLDEDAHIYIIDADGKNFRQLADTPDYTLYASWLKDSVLSSQPEVIATPTTVEILATPVTSDATPQGAECRVVIKDNLNLRASPGKGRILLVVPVGTEAVVMARSDDNAWWKIRYNDLEGWVNKRFTETHGSCSAVLREGEATPQPTLAPTGSPSDETMCFIHSRTDLNVRDVPVSGAVLLVIPQGEEAGVIGRLADTSWWKVSYHGQEGWIRNLLLETRGDCTAIPIEETAASTDLMPTAAHETSDPIFSTPAVATSSLTILAAIDAPISETTSAIMG